MFEQGPLLMGKVKIMADILIRNTSTGQLYLNEMDGNVKAGTNVGSLSTEWRVVDVQ